MQISLFLGAGAAAWAGYRTFLTFPGLFWPSGKQPAELEVTDKERKLLDEMRTHLVKRHMPFSLDNYLALISDYMQETDMAVSHTILRERLIQSTLQWASIQELRELLINLRERICKLTSLHYNSLHIDKKNEHTGLYIDFMQSLAELNSNRILELFTTNYDTLLEFLLSENRHFKNTRKEKNISYKNVLLLHNWFENMTDASVTAEIDLIKEKNGKPQAKIPYFTDLNNKSLQKTNSMPEIICTRLHGCVAWFHGKIGSQNLYYSLKGPKEEFSKKICISYPGHEQFYGRAPFKEAYLRFSCNCLNTDVLIFIGFSFRDKDVISVLGKSLWARQELKQTQKNPYIFIIDPHMTEAEVCNRLYSSSDHCAGPMINWQDQFKTGHIAVIRSYFPEKKLHTQILEAVNNGKQR